MKTSKPNHTNRTTAALKRENAAKLKESAGSINPSTGNSLLDQKVIAYASGSGSISFTWQGTDALTGDKIAFKSPTAAEIIKADVMRPGWKLVQLDGEVQAVGQVTRVNEHVLEIPPEKYREYIGRFGYDPEQSGHTEFKVLMSDLAPAHELKNISLLSRLRFFLKHELEINRQLKEAQ